MANRGRATALSAKLIGGLASAALIFGACASSSATPSAPAASSGAAPTAAASVEASVAPSESSGGGTSDATVTMLVTSFGNELFDPFSSDNTAQYFQRLIGAPLIEGNGTGGGLVPGIIKSWEMSPDAKTWTFTVGTGVKAQNGEAITAEEVRWNLDSRFGEEAKARIAAGEKVDPNTVEEIVALVKKVSVSGTDKVVIELNEARPDFANRMSTNQPDASNIVIPEDYFKQVGAAGFEKAPIGTGPFKLVSHTPGQEMVFERYDDYYYQPANGFSEDRRPKFKTLILRAVPDASTRVSALQAGQADIIAANVLMAPDIKSAGGSLAYSKESARPEINFLDCWDPGMWCQKKEVRQALEYAIDKQSILDQLYGPDAGELRGWEWVTPSAAGYVAGVTDPYPFDVEKAKALLAQAGYPGGAGIPQVIINTWEGGIPFLPEVAQIMADSWKAIGVQATVQVGDEQAVRDAFNTRKLSGQVLLRDNDGQWLGTGITTALYLDDTYSGRYCDSKDPTCAALAAEIGPKISGIYPDTAALNAAYQEAYTVLRAEDRQFSLFTLNQPWGLGARIASYQPWPLNPYDTAMWTITLK